MDEASASRAATQGPHVEPSEQIPSGSAGSEPEVPPADEPPEQAAPAAELAAPAAEQAPDMTPAGNGSAGARKTAPGAGSELEKPAAAEPAAEQVAPAAKQPPDVTPAGSGSAGAGKTAQGAGSEPEEPPAAEPAAEQAAPAAKQAPDMTPAADLAAPAETRRQQQASTGAKAAATEASPSEASVGELLWVGLRPPLASTQPATGQAAPAAEQAPDAVPAAKRAVASSAGAAGGDEGALRVGDESEAGQAAAMGLEAVGALPPPPASSEHDGAGDRPNPQAPGPAPPLDHREPPSAHATAGPPAQVASTRSGGDGLRADEDPEVGRGGRQTGGDTLPREAAELLRKIQRRARTRFGPVPGAAGCGGEGEGNELARMPVLSSTDDLLAKFAKMKAAEAAAMRSSAISRCVYQLPASLTRRARALSLRPRAFLSRSLALSLAHTLAHAFAHVAINTRARAHTHTHTWQGT